MSNKYDLVIFDLDGTILDTTEGVLSAVKYTINEFGFQKLDDTVMSTFIGPPIQDSFAKMYGLSGSILQDIATVFRNRYSSIDLLKAKPYEGIYDVFREISTRQMTSAIATYKREDYALTLLRHYNFDHYTTIMYGGDHENKLKKNDIIQKCIKDSGVKDLKRVVMVGDTEHDALGAEKVGVDFIGVTFGFGFQNMKDLSSIKSVGCAERAIDILNFL